MDSVFDHKNHFSYLRMRFDKKNSPHGTKTKFSEHLQMQGAFLSQVLSEKYCLSLEQAVLANEFFDHSSDESDFFIFLVSRDRAGSHALRKHFQEKIDVILKKRQLVIERIGKKTLISPDAQGVYYSSWVYSAVHMCCTIPKLNTKKSISEYLKVSEITVGKVLEFLIDQNLVQKSGEGYHVTENWVRLDKDSPHIVKLHSNWRFKAVQAIEDQSEKDLHYSGVFSIDEKAAQEIKELLMELLKKNQTIVQKADSADLFSLGIDLFKLTK